MLQQSICTLATSLLLHSKPIGVLEGQGSPLFRVRIDPANDRIYSVSNDNTVKVLL